MNTYDDEKVVLPDITRKACDDISNAIQSRGSITAQELKRMVRLGDSYSRLPTLLDLWAWADEREWLTLLGEEWTGCDNVGEHIDQLFDSPFGWQLDGGGAIAEMMNADELAAYNALPDEVTVYRGCYQSNKWGICWSLDRDVAIKFPTLFRYYQEGQPLLVKAMAKKNNIAAVKLDRGEIEVITWRPKHISTSYIRKQAS